MVQFFYQSGNEESDHEPNTVDEGYFGVDPSNEIYYLYSNFLGHIASNSVSEFCGSHFSSQVNRDYLSLKRSRGALASRCKNVNKNSYGMKP